MFRVSTTDFLPELDSIRFQFKQFSNRRFRNVDTEFIFKKKLKVSKNYSKRQIKSKQITYFFLHHVVVNLPNSVQRHL